MSEDKKELSVIKRTAISLIDAFSKNLKERVLTECSDEKIMSTTSKYHPALKDSYKEEDFVNYDEALRMMPFGYNRNRLNNLAKKYGIKNHTFKNAHIGFKKTDIEGLVDKAKEE